MSNKKRPVGTVWNFGLSSKRTEAKETRVGRRVAFNAQQKIKFDVIEAETETKCFLANVKFDERNTFNFCSFTNQTELDLYASYN